MASTGAGCYGLPVPARTGLGLPVPRYWASGRGAMLPASSVGTATRTRRQLSMALSSAARESVQPAGPVANQEGSGRGRGRLQKPMTPTRSIDLLASVLHAASHLVLQARKQPVRLATTRYDVWRAVRQPANTAQAAESRLRISATQSSALPPAARGSAVEAIDSDAIDAARRAACAYYRSSRAPWPRRSGTPPASGRSARRSRASRRGRTRSSGMRPVL